jgi:hypothetical protein
MIDTIMVMNEVFSTGYCSITWLNKSFSTNSSALIGSVYLYFVKRRIQDPMTQNLKKEFTYVAIAVGSSLFLSSKSYLFKCSYKVGVVRGGFSMAARAIELWNVSLIPIILWNWAVLQ